MKSTDLLNYILATGFIGFVLFASFVLYEILKTIRAVRSVLELLIDYSLDTKWYIGRFFESVFPLIGIFRRR